AGACSQNVTVVVEEKILLVSNATTVQRVFFTMHFANLPISSFDDDSFNATFRAAYVEDLATFAQVEQTSVVILKVVAAEGGEGTSVWTSVETPPENPPTRLVNALQEGGAHHIFSDDVVLRDYGPLTVSDISVEVEEENSDKGLSAGIKALLSIGGILIAVLASYSGYTAYRHHKLHSMYTRMVTSEKELYLGDSFQLEDASEFENREGDSSP
ncbi:hypothetical protein CYMTET_27804, partial [Cymbomonas tetramitiformis]